MCLLDVSHTSVFIVFLGIEGQVLENVMQGQCCVWGSLLVEADKYSGDYWNKRGLN